VKILEAFAVLLQPELEKVSSELEKGAKVKVEKRRPWNVAKHRSGKRPMSVDTMLKKEKDGTLNVKLGQFYGSVVPFSDIREQGAAPLGKKNPDNIPSRESIDQGVKRQDSRDFAATVQAPGNALLEAGVTNQPQERTASANPAYLAMLKIGGAGYEAYIRKEAEPYLLTNAAERHTDLGGLGLMAGSSLDKLRSQIKHPGNPQQGSLVGGMAGRSGMDLAGLGAMATPTIARMAAGPGHGSRFTNIANLAGLGALAVPTIDNIQAGIRARRAGVDPEKKMLLGHKAHAIAELAGLGTLAAPVAREGLNRHSAMLLGGYGTLAAPVVEDLVQHDEKKKLFQGAGRSATELAGLGLLAGGTLGHH
jgi:hypothetical protein